MNRGLVVGTVVLAVIALPLAGPFAAAQTGPSSAISIPNVTVSPESPVPGERVTMDATVENLPNSQTNVQIDSVYVREYRGDGFDEHDRIRDLGGLNPGASITVPVSATFEEPGTKRLRVVVNAVNDDGDRIRVNYPVTLDVADRHPQIDVDVNDSVATERARGTVTVANGLDVGARNVEIQLSSEGLALSDARSIHPLIGSGDSARAHFGYEAPTAGTYDVQATMRYRIDGSRTRTVTENVSIPVDPATSTVVVQASQPDSGDPVVSVDVQNRGNVPIENVSIRGESPNATVPSRLVGTIPAKSSRSVRLNASLSATRAPVTVTAAYESGDRTHRRTAGLELRETPGRIELTGVDVEHSVGRLQVTGSASNVGLTGVDSVVVTVLDTERVSPAPPAGEYFVGRVPASDFVSFDVSARVDGNATSVPVRVEYLVDGQRHERRVDVPINADEGVAEAPDPDGSSGGLVVPALGGLLVLGVGGVMVRAWRASRDGA